MNQRLGKLQITAVNFTTRARAILGSWIKDGMGFGGD